MAKIKLQIDPTDKILLKRNLNKNGKGAALFYSRSEEIVHALCSILIWKTVE